MNYLCDHLMNCDGSFDVLCIVKNALETTYKYNSEHAKQIAIPIDDKQMYSGICPNCGSYISRVWHEKYCGDCGQRISWEGNLTTNENK